MLQTMQQQFKIDKSLVFTDYMPLVPRPLSSQMLNVAKGHRLKIICILTGPLPVVCLHIKGWHGMRSRLFKAIKWNWWISIISHGVWIYETTLVVWHVICEVWIELWHHVWILWLKPVLKILWIRRRFSIVLVIRVWCCRAIQEALSCLFLERSQLCL